MYDVVKDQYDDYVSKLGTKRNRTSELSETALVKEVALTTLYCLSAIENSSTNMTTVLGLLETLSGETITPPSLVITGLEVEAAGAEDVDVTAGSNTITFPLTLSSANYSLLITCTTTDGNFNAFKRSNKTTSGFTIEVAEDGYLDYRAIIV
jgi:hypothetical protein